MMHDDEYEDDDAAEFSLRPNKAELKRQTQALKDLVQQLIALPAARLEGITIDENIRTAVLAAKKMERTALNRQIKYITGLMREQDEAVITRELYLLAQPHKQQVQAFHEVEQWRDALIAGDDGLLNELIERFSTVDRQHLRQLVRNARKEKALVMTQGKPPRAARLLFTYLTELQGQE
jgi:ribosome-associated protein